MAETRPRRIEWYIEEEERKNNRRTEQREK